MPPRRQPRHGSSLPAVSAGVALVAVDAVVDVPVDFGMVEVGGIVPAVTLGALEDRIVVRIGMASRAYAIRVAMGDREPGVLRVIERRGSPACGGMAG